MVMQPETTPTVAIPDDSGSIGGWNFDGRELQLLLSEEREGVVSQWFYLRLSDLPTLDELVVTIANAGRSIYPKGWPGYRPCISEDGRDWQRTSAITLGKNGVAEFHIERPSPKLYLAWYEPYPVSRMKEWVQQLETSSPVNVEHEVPDCPCLTLGIPQKGTIVVIARQHPGETMSSFFVEGFIDALVSDAGRPEVSAMLRQFEFVVFPMMNPGGVLRGRHRFSDQGSDYNRVWTEAAAPSEIAHVKLKIARISRLGAFFDIHGDEVSKGASSYIEHEPLNYAGGSQRERRLLKRICESAPDLEILHPPGWFRNLTLRHIRGEHRSRRVQGTAARYVSDRYHVPSLTYEINAHETTGADCRRMGRALVDAFALYSEMR